MTLGQLIEQLTLLRDELGDDALVVMSEDSGGNGYSPLAEAEIAMYAANTTWSGERYMTEADRLAEVNPDEYAQAPADAVKAAFLWPTN